MGYVGVSGGAGEVVKRALADAARGEVDYAAEADVVVGVGDKAQVGGDVFDFLALVKLLPADYLVGDAVAQAGVFKGAGLGVDAVHHGYVAEPVAGRDGAGCAGGVGVAGAGEAFYFLDYELRLFVFVVALVYGDWDAGVVAGPEIFLDALGVGRDEAAGGVQDGLGGAVVFL